MDDISTDVTQVQMGNIYNVIWRRIMVKYRKGQSKNSLNPSLLLYKAFGIILIHNDLIGAIGFSYLLYLFLLKLSMLNLLLSVIH